MKNISQIQRKIVPYVFVAPFIISLFVFYLYPLISTVIMSFQNIVPGEVEFIGLDNYKRLNDEHFFIAIKNSFVYTILTIAVLIPIPLILATVLNNKKCLGSRFFRSAFFIPSLISVVVAGTIIRLLFASPEGAFINSILGFFNIEAQKWLMAGRIHAMFLLVIIALWRWTGINIIYFLSGLQTIPNELYEAADIDGANTLQKFKVITLPLLKPIIIFVTTISILGGFSMFEESYILWSGNSPNNIGLTMVGYVYRKGFQSGDLGMGSAVGLVLLLIIVVLSLGELSLWGFFKRGEK
ncbi:MAG: sugar ABC transporter permease [Spirochaetaceae bacterium]|jgi:arabinosaccharide transport system permease protein|nr:sugar ABC transporter permease [Spirochaetaceae bacterium]